MKKAVLCLLAVLLLAVPALAEDMPIKAADLAAPSVSGALQVAGTQLCGADGKPVQLRGVSTHGLAWFPDYVNEDCFRQLREDWNVNVVRLAMYTEEYGGYCSGGNQAALKALIDKGVACAVAQDLYVIIDWHILSDGNPNRHLEEAKGFFEEVSSKYADCPNVIYEICNEPNGGVNWAEIKRYAEAVTGVIRKHAKDAVILVGTPNWSQHVDQAAADPISGGNLMYTLHFYAATHTDALRKTMVSALEKGLPLFVSEYGICDASGNGAVDIAQANLWIEAMDRYGVSYVAWNLSNKAETSAILRSGCKKTSGFTGEDLSVSGQWLYQMLTAEKKAVPPVVPGKTKPAVKRSAANTPAEVSCMAVLQNHWESSGEFFYQYTLTVRNNGKTACNSWNVKAVFNGPVILRESWNGDYFMDGNTLCIAPKDYNKEIPAGGSVEDIGFIVKGGKGLGLLYCSN